MNNAGYSVSRLKPRRTYSSFPLFYQFQYRQKSAILQLYVGRSFSSDALLSCFIEISVFWGNSIDIGNEVLENNTPPQAILRGCTRELPKS